MPEISNQNPPPHQYATCSLPGTAGPTAASIVRRGTLSYRNNQLRLQMAQVKQLLASQDYAFQILNRLEARAQHLMSRGDSSLKESARTTSRADFRAEIERCQTALGMDQK